MKKIMSTKHPKKDHFSKIFKKMAKNFNVSFTISKQYVIMQNDERTFKIGILLYYMALSNQELSSLNSELSKTIGSQIMFNYKVDKNLKTLNKKMPLL